MSFLCSSFAVFIWFEFLFINNTFITNKFFMNHDYLFESDLPDGVKSVFLNGKKISRDEFLERQKKLRKKKELKFEP